MFGNEVWRLIVMTEEGSTATVIFQKEGNYGDNWNYGQATLNSTANVVVCTNLQIFNKSNMINIKDGYFVWYSGCV